MNSENHNEIVLRLDREDRAMVFDDPNERLQRDAYAKAFKQLQSGKKLAKEIDQSRNNKKSSYLLPNKSLDRYHNTIFIDGARGTGKTAFMLNLERAYEDFLGQQDNGLYFCQPIDPTLLNFKEDFINVVIGQLHSEIEAFVQQSHGDMPNDYIESLERVVEALESEHTAKNSYGVDRMLAFKGSLELERQLYEYFAQAKDLLECTAIVLLIDDVDMSLEVAFNVLEVIRKYLACPFILSVVSGDKSLYQTIITRKFVRKLAINTQNPKASEIDNSRELAERYLQKIFPQDREIKLLLITELEKTSPIFIRHNHENIPLARLQSRLRDIIFAGATHVDKPWTDFTPRTARDLSQLSAFLNLLPEEMLNKLFSLKIQEKSALYRNIELLNELVKYFSARGKNILAKSLFTTVEMLNCTENKYDPVMLRDLSIFNITELSSENSDNFFAQKSIELLRGRIYKSTDVVIQEKYFSQLKPLLINFPAVEPYSTSLLISKRRIGEIHDIDEKILLALYTHHDYFSSHNSGYLIFFGKVFELVFTSLLRTVSAEDIKTLLHRAPFHSFFHYFATKTVDEEREEEIEDPDDGDSNHILLDEKHYQALADKINQWHTDYAKLNFSAQQIYCTFFKYFNNIEVLKSYGFVAEQPLLKLHQRVKFILLNATASYEIGSEGLVNQGIALNKNFNADNLIKYDSSYLSNIIPLLERPSLTKAIDHHPIFELEGFEQFTIQKQKVTTTGKKDPSTSKKDPSTKPPADEITSAGARAARIRALKINKLPTIEEIIAMGSDAAPKYIEEAMGIFITDKEVNKHKAIYKQQLSDNRAFFGMFYSKAKELGMADPLDKWFDE